MRTTGVLVVQIASAANPPFRRSSMCDIVSQSVEPVAAQKKSYVAPIIAECSEMAFAEEIWRELGDGQQFQCFHCNCSDH